MEQSAWRAGARPEQGMPGEQRDADSGGHGAAAAAGAGHGADRHTGVSSLRFTGRARLCHGRALRALAVRGGPRPGSAGAAAAAAVPAIPAAAGPGPAAPPHAPEPGAPAAPAPAPAPASSPPRTGHGAFGRALGACLPCFLYRGRGGAHRDGATASREVTMRCALHTRSIPQKS